MPFTFGEPGSSPQIMDLWVLDLDAIAWTRPPLMPAYTSLKGTDVAWAADGRLVLVGRFPEKGLVATWRPGDAGYLVRPFDRPETPAGALVDTGFLVVQPASAGRPPARSASFLPVAGRDDARGAYTRSDVRTSDRVCGRKASIPLGRDTPGADA